MDVSKATLVRVGIGVVLVNTAMVGASAVGTLVAAAAQHVRDVPPDEVARAAAAAFAH